MIVLGSSTLKSRLRPFHLEEIPREWEISYMRKTGPEY